jgi:hypothetical protein
MQWVAERKSLSIRKNGPVIHRVTAEDVSIYVSDIDYEYAARTQQRVLHVNLAVVSVRNKKINQNIVACFAQNCFAAAASPAANPDPDGDQGKNQDTADNLGC